MNIVLSTAEPFTADLAVFVPKTFQKSELIESYYGRTLYLNLSSTGQVTKMYERGALQVDVQRLCRYALRI